MDHEETLRRCYELLNAGDVDGHSECADAAYPLENFCFHKQIGTNPHSRAATPLIAAATR